MSQLPEAPTADVVGNQPEKIYFFLATQKSVGAGHDGVTAQPLFYSVLPLATEFSAVLISTVLSPVSL